MRQPVEDNDDLLPTASLADVMRQRPAGIGSVRHAIQIAVAVTVSWFVAESVGASVLPLFAPVTTLLVVQASPWSSLGVSIQRVLGTGLGVLAASVYVNVLGVTWWSFLIGVLGSLLVARAIPWSIGGQLQIPIAVVFVFALGPGTVAQDVWRVLDVLIGGVIGVLAVLAFVTRPDTRPVEGCLRRYRDAIVDVVHLVGAQVGREPLAEGALHPFVLDSRRLREPAVACRDALGRLGEESMLNPRARDARAEVQYCALRVRRLGSIALQVRGLAGSANLLYDRADLVPTLRAEELSGLCAELADTIRACLGVGDDPVGSSDPGQATVHLERLEARVQHLAHAVSERHEQVGDMLESVSILGRVDHLRRQLALFPRRGPIGDDESDPGPPGTDPGRQA